MIYGVLYMKIIENEFFSSIADNIYFSVYEASAVIDKDWKSTPVSKPAIKLYFIESGEGAWLADENEFIYMLPGHIYLIPPYHVHSYGVIGNETVHKIYVDVYMDYPDGDSVFSSFGCFGDLYAPEIIKTIRQYNVPNVLAFYKTQATVIELLLKMAEKYKFNPPEKGRYSKVVENAIKYIHKRTTKQLTRDDIAKYCGVATVTLSKRFSKEVGKSIPAYINEIVLKKAAQMLRFTDIPLTEISDTLGFSDRFYFSREFTKFYDIPPLRYRKNNNFTSK